MLGGGGNGGGVTGDDNCLHPRFNILYVGMKPLESSKATLGHFPAVFQPQLVF